MGRAPGTGCRVGHRLPPWRRTRWRTGRPGLGQGRCGRPGHRQPVPDVGGAEMPRAGRGGRATGSRDRLGTRTRGPHRRAGRELRQPARDRPVRARGFPHSRGGLSDGRGTRAHGIRDAPATGRMKKKGHPRVSQRTPPGRPLYLQRKA
ncbi:hypothetical protein MASSI9I_20895 [Massilia sp. 9I]|nr:hypothetical protein MASSI9I_20895 [Massilia sp. 9I]